MEGGVHYCHLRISTSFAGNVHIRKYARRKTYLTITVFFKASWEIEYWQQMNNIGEKAQIWALGEVCPDFFFSFVTNPNATNDEKNLRIV